MAAIGKAGAAERMVVSAIIMAERGEDQLAIHVVAAAALNVLRDLIDKAGDEYVDQVLKIGAFTVASARVKGEPVTIPTNAAIVTGSPFTRAIGRDRDRFSLHPHDPDQCRDGYRCRASGRRH